MKKMLFVIPLLMLCSCDENETIEPVRLDGTYWNFSSFESPKDVKTPQRQVYIWFDNGKISGYAGVNKFSCGYTLEDDGSFKAGPYMITRMAGPGLQFETIFMDNIEATDKLTVVGDVLSLYKGTEKTVSFNRGQPPVKKK